MKTAAVILLLATFISGTGFAQDGVSVGVSVKHDVDRKAVRVEIDGKDVGVAIFDHRDNPRHPTTWHARDYGLIAANPYGLNDFQKKGKNAGDLTIAKGESQRFRYYFLFHKGGHEAADIPTKYEGWLDR